jgi:hypothetical protein
MYPFIYIQIHMLEARVKQLEKKQVHEEFRYSETLLARLVHFLRNEAFEEEAADNPVAMVIFIMSYFYF